MYANDGWLEDIYYTIRNTSGGVVTPITRFTNGVAGDDYYYSPTLTALSGNRALLAYYGPNGISYGVLDSGGATVKAETSAGGYGWGPDAVQLSDGSVVIAWSGSVEFVVLDDTTYDVIAGPTSLYNPAASTGDTCVSIAADAAGHAILTWMDSDWNYRHNLYYALVDGNGDVLTAPMIFRTSQAMDSHIETSYGGYGNTSFSDSTPPTSQARSPEFATGPFLVTWSGSDVGVGLASYDVQVRDGAGGTWTDWLAGTTGISATYAAAETGHIYYFRSVAHDLAGNVETDLPADGDTHTTIAAYEVEGQVTNNRHQPVFNAMVSAQPPALSAAATDAVGEYALYLDSSGAYTLTASRSGFGDLPPRYDMMVNGDLYGVDLVLPPEDEAVTNGGWETGDLSNWNSGPGVTPTVEMAAAHTGRHGVRLSATGGILGFWPYITQTISVPVTWSQPTLSFMYRVMQGSTGDVLLATVSNGNEPITHTVSLTPGGWMHAWHDLGAFSGQTVTLRFGFQDQTGTQQVYLDEISLGESKPGAFPIYLPLVLRNAGS